MNLAKYSHALRLCSCHASHGLSTHNTIATESRKKLRASKRRCRLRLSGHRNRCVGRCAKLRERTRSGLRTRPIKSMPATRASWPNTIADGSRK